MALIDVIDSAAPSLEGASLGSQEARIIEAALRCIARWGLAKTSLDDVAREAGYSRATVYRFFPGGKDSLIEAVVRSELSEFFAAITRHLDGADTLEEALVAAISESARRMQGHAALQFLLENEPEVVLPQLAFHGMDNVLRAASQLIGPHLSRFTGADRSAAAAEWLTRMVVSYSACPSDDVDLTDRQSVRRLVRSFVLPALLVSTAH